MIFNSLSYAIFLPTVFLLYWLVFRKSLKWQNRLLLIVSYFFYACWDERFLFLLLFSTLLDYVAGIKLNSSKSISIRRIWFWSSILINLGFLGIFKYYNFFSESFSELFSNFGIQLNLWTLNILLPVGISFYTFHGLSYIIDINNEKIKPERNFVEYALFVTYFPLLVAGPIERATHLLPQIKSRRVFNYLKVTDGLRQILWGLFKKIVIADSCAEYANDIFNNYENFSGGTLFLGAIMFTIQIYCDFSGYTDIALGSSRLLGIELLTNFKFPYFSRSVSEFWKRWHISLSSWFKDYLYIPLGGSNNGKLVTLRNTFIIFLVSGFWHGANWTFIFWGLINAIYIIPSILFSSNKKQSSTINKLSFRIILNIILTFFFTILAWIIFRSNSIKDAYLFLVKIFSDMFSKIFIVDILNYCVWEIGYFKLLLIVFMFSIEWMQRDKAHGLYNFMHSQKPYFRWFTYIVISLLILFYSGKQETFIYFQF